MRASPGGRAAILSWCASPKACTTADGQPGASCDGEACVPIGGCDPTATFTPTGTCLECTCVCLIDQGQWNITSAPCDTPLVLAFDGERVEFTHAGGAFDSGGRRALGRHRLGRRRYAVARAGPRRQWQHRRRPRALRLDDRASGWLARPQRIRGPRGARRGRRRTHHDEGSRVRARRRLARCRPGPPEHAGRASIRERGRPGGDRFSRTATSPAAPAAAARSSGPASSSAMRADRSARAT